MVIKMYNLFWVLMLVLLSACSEKDSQPTTTAVPDREPDVAATGQLFFNGDIYTVNEQQPWVEAVHVIDGKIAFAGSETEARSQAGIGVELVDLDGAMMMPGIQDVHMHPLEAKSPFAGTCVLSSTEDDPENFVAELKVCAPDQLATDWVLGSGHSVFTLLDAERLPVEILDEAIPDRPALIMAETSHSVWVNSQALALAGIDKNTPNPVGGVIVKDADSGEPTGLLFDAAGDVLMSLAWLPAAEIKKLNYQGLLEALKEVNSYGITSVVEGRTYWKREFQDAWFQAERDGKLTVRAMLNLWAYPAEDDDHQIATIKSLYHDKPDSLVRIRQVKVYSDGILINSTAAMLEAYLETLGEIPGKNGLNYFTEQRLAKYIRELGDFDFHIHAIGDRGVRESLNAIEAAGNAEARHRLTHLEVVNIDDYLRFKSLGVIADMQVAGHFTQPENWNENEFLIGNRSSPLVPLRSLYHTGAKVTLSSDWDVSTLSPFVGMQNALTRKPQNMPDMAAVIKAYTLTPAYALRQEATTGSIEVGKYADLIVLDQNLLEVAATQVSKTKVLETYLAGKRVYSAE